MLSPLAACMILVADMSLDNLNLRLLFRSFIQKHSNIPEGNVSICLCPTISNQSFIHREGLLLGRVIVCPESLLSRR